MTIMGALILVLVIVCIGMLAYWIITKFFPQPAQTIALAIVGIILLLILLSQFIPDAANYRIWR